MGFWSENRIGIVIAAVLMVVGGAYYVFAGLGEGMGAETGEEGAMAGGAREAATGPALYDGMELKSAIAEGDLKLFALAPNNALMRLEAAEGDTLPERGSIVIGSDEAAMMEEEKLFASPGDEVKGFFGIDIRVGGVLADTGSLPDMLHFLGPEQFLALEAESGRAFVEMSPEGPKLFYRVSEEEIADSTLELEFAEGGLANYETHEIAGDTYYPVIIGADEAAMMKEEKLFAAPGDPIKGFFGTNVIVAGVLAERGDALDMGHILPLGADALG